MTSSTTILRIGTRRSMLAMAQSQLVADMLGAAHAGLQAELVPIITSGDRYFGPLNTAGGKGLFTAELEQALRDGSIDLAVHSAKDMPAEMANDFAIAAVPTRADPSDALVTQTPGATLEQLPAGAIVGTSSSRRAAQVLAVRNDLKIQPLRGNVETRIAKVIAEHQADATILAMAGLTRSRLLEQHRRYVTQLALEQFVPASGQGCLALQTLASRRDVAALLAAVDDTPSHQALLDERRVVAAMQADCHSALAVHVHPRQGAWQAMFAAASPAGTGLRSGSANAATADAAASQLIDLMLRQDIPVLLHG